MDVARTQLVCDDCPALAGCVFADLSPESFAEFQKIVELRREPGRRRVLVQGERVAGVLLVRSGLLRRVHMEPSGRLADLGLARPGDLVGLTEIVTGSRAADTAETVQPCELEFVPRSAFVPFVRHTPQVAVALLVRVSDDLERVRNELCDRLTHALPPRQRLLAVLRELAEVRGVVSGDGGGIRLRVPVHELAERLGMTRQWTSCLLQGLIAEGAVKRVGRSLVLTVR
jgi:CRP/FNR family transcriptional regulator